MYIAVTKYISFADANDCISVQAAVHLQHSIAVSTVMHARCYHEGTYYFAFLVEVIKDPNV